MKFKIQFLGLLIIVLFVSCTDQVSFEGKLLDVTPSSNELMAYLLSPESLEDVASPFRGEIVDSALVQLDGSFSFRWKPKGEKAILLEIVLQLKGERYPRRLVNDSPLVSNYMPVVYSGDPIEFESTSKSFLRDFELKNPQPENASILQLRDIRLKAYETYLKGRVWDIHEGTGLLEKEEAHLNYQRELIRFADTTSFFVPSMIALRWVSPQLDYERVPEFLFGQCNKWEGKDHPWKESLCSMSEKHQLPALVGDAFPKATLPLNSGEEQNLYGLLGEKLTLVDVWASWCVPCRKENRDVLVPLWENYHQQGFQIVGYGLETNENAWKSAIEKDGANRWINASHLTGDEAPLMQQLRIHTIPANYLLDSEGTILAKNLHGDRLEQFVKDYFEKLL